MAGVIPPEDEDFELILVFPSAYGMIFGSIIVDEVGTEAPPLDVSDGIEPIGRYPKAQVGRMI